MTGLQPGKKFDFRLLVAPIPAEGVSSVMLATPTQSPPSPVVTFSTAKAPPEVRVGRVKRP